MIRAESLRQIENAQQDLRTQLEALRHADTSHLRQDVLSSGSAKLQQLSALRDQLVGGAKDVTALRASIASAVADIRAYTSDVRTAAGGAQTGASSAQSAQMALNKASEAAHSNVVNFMSDYYDQRKFDPYLKFASVTDEEEYRRREEQTKKDIEKALAEKTPEGDLRASQLSIEQLKDAGAHGASRSADYKPELDRLVATGSALQGQLSSAAKNAAAQARRSSATTDTNASVSDKVELSPDVIAGLKNVGVAASGQSDGHGVTAGRVQQTGARSPG